MRTTVTIDPDVEELLRQAMRRTGKGFKTTLNGAVRQALGHAAEAESPFVVEAQPMGIRAGIDPHRLQHVGDDLEIDAFLGLTRRLQEGAPARP
jgi:hypothetical protein